KITKASGDNQTGTAGATLPNPLVVQVRDASGNPSPNVAVTFAISGGGGSPAPTTANTNPTGPARHPLPPRRSSPTSDTLTPTGIGSVICNAGVRNAIYLENQQPGTTAWKITNPVTASAPEIAGYAGATSVNKGASLPFKITLAQPGQYRIDVYRLGYYAGTGARLMGTFGPFAGVTQA